MQSPVENGHGKRFAIVAKSSGCAAAQALKGLRFLAPEAPFLPLDACPRSVDAGLR
jgi:hypothetical protein